MWYYEKPCAEQAGLYLKTKTMIKRTEIQKQIGTFTKPDTGIIVDELIQARKWTDAAETESKAFTFEEGVEYALKWVLGINDENPIQEKFKTN